MSNVTVLQTAANRFSRVAGFPVISVDGQVGSQTINAVQRSLDYIAVINDDSISENVSDQAAAWASASRTSSTLTANAQPIGGFLTFVADLMRLPIIAAPMVSSGGGGGGGAVVIPPMTNIPGLQPATLGANILATIKALPTWQKIIFGAIAGFSLIWAWGHFSKSKGLAGLSSETLHLFTYKNKHGTYSDVWARDSEHAHQQIRKKKNKPSGFFSIARVTNVPPRKVAG